MARPERHDVDYFPFILKRGKTLNILQTKFGLEGIGFFTNLLRFLGTTPDHYYCIKEEYDRLNFFSEIGMQDEDRGIAIIELMVMTGKLDKQLWEEHMVIASEAFLDSLEDAYKRRTNKIITIAEIKDIFNKGGKNPVYVDDNEVIVDILYTETQENSEIDDNKPQRKLKETKLKESKGKKRKVVSGSDEPQPQETSLVSAKSKILALSPEQLILFNAAKACFESSPRASAMIFKDKNTAALQMRKLKELTIACTNIEPNFSIDFMWTLLEHFRVMTNGKLKGKAEFTPRALSTPWIWETVIGALPDNEGVSEELINSIRGLFK